jgi:hypothetical protein
VAGIEEEREVGPFELAPELASSVLHPMLVEVTAFDHVEAQFSQRLRDVGGVIRWIAKLRGVLIFAVADDERDATADRDSR